MFCRVSYLFPPLFFHQESLKLMPSRCAALQITSNFSMVFIVQIIWKEDSWFISTEQFAPEFQRKTGIGTSWKATKEPPGGLSEKNKPSSEFVKQIRMCSSLKGSQTLHLVRKKKQSHNFVCLGVYIRNNTCQIGCESLIFICSLIIPSLQFSTIQGKRVVP